MTGEPIHATGGARATTLRTVYRAEMVDPHIAAAHYWRRINNNPPLALFEHVRSEGAAACLRAAADAIDAAKDFRP